MTELFADGTVMGVRPSGYWRRIGEGLDRFEVQWHVGGEVTISKRYGLTEADLVAAMEAIADMKAEYRWRGKLGGIE